MANLILWNTLGVNAPARPAGVHILANWLRQHGYTVKVIDFCILLTKEELVAITEKHIGPDTLAIGVSSTFWIFRESPLAIPTRKYLEPEWIIEAREEIDSRHKVSWMLGGLRAMQGPTKFEWVRFMGYSENDVLRWMDVNSNKLIRRSDFDITCADRFPDPGDCVQPEEFLSIELTRGCKFKCKFCSFPLVGRAPGTYMRDPKLIKDEILRNYDTFGTTRYYYVDDTVNESMEKVTELANIAQSLPFELEWVGYNRLDLIGTNPGMAQALKDSGLRSTQFGIESFHPEASRVIGKGWNGKYGKDYLLKLKEEWGKDIVFFMSFIIGLPGEDEKSIDETHQWCIDNEMYAWTWLGLAISRFPGKYWKSEFEKNAPEYGYKFTNPDDPEYWEIGEWNSLSVHLKGRELNKYCFQKSMLYPWRIGEMGSLGYSINELIDMFINTPLRDLNTELFEKQTYDFVRRYAANQMK